MSAPSEIIERIKKLLRLARSSNRHEAELAMARALELAAEHCVAIERLNADECAKEKATTHRVSEALSRVTYDREFANEICCRFFGVTALENHFIRMVDRRPRSAVRIIWVGTRSEIEIATYVAAFLTRHFAFCWNRFGGRFRNRKAYVYGMYLGVARKLDEEMPKFRSSGTELVLAEQKAYIAAQLGEPDSVYISPPDHRAHGAFIAGFRQGGQTQIRPALKPSKQPTLALER